MSSSVHCSVKKNTRDEDSIGTAQLQEIQGYTSELVRARSTSHVVFIPFVAVLNTSTDQPVPVIIKSAISHPGRTLALLIPLIILALLNGIACTTASSPCVWAFARDGAIPGSAHWKTVNRSLGVPLNAMCLAWRCRLRWSDTAFNAFSSAGVIFLTVSYAVPMAVSLGGRRRHVPRGSFDLGVLGVFCNVVALLPMLVEPLFWKDGEEMRRMTSSTYWTLSRDTVSRGVCDSCSSKAKWGVSQD
ncbi:hypothetical protein BDW62DRAFT_203947 [Aspergillus aurantiobrunneus]